MTLDIDISRPMVPMVHCREDDTQNMTMEELVSVIAGQRVVLGQLNMSVDELVSVVANQRDVLGRLQKEVVIWKDLTEMYKGMSDEFIGRLEAMSILQVVHSSGMAL